MTDGNGLLFEVLHCGMAIVQLQFIEDVVDVILHGRYFDMEPHRDLLIAQPIVDQPDNLGLTSGERSTVTGTGLHSDLANQRRHATKDEARNPWRAECFSFHDRMNVVHEIIQ